MNAPDTAGGDPGIQLIEDAPSLVALAERCSRAQAIALDVEANGLFAYRPKLCTVQLAWREGDTVVVAVVDTLVTGASLLCGVLGEGGPVKVLHDLAFDARLLEESGVPLGNVRDTSVSARLLGYKAGGLAALLASELGIKVDKQLQQHDWSRRPLRPHEIRYLGDDVRYLLPLDEKFAAKAAEVGIEDEIAEECAYKLEAARRPPRDARPSYVRVKGASALDREGRAVLRRLCDARDAAAEAEDVPPFKVASSEVLLELAQKRPKSVAGLRAVAGATAGRTGRYASEWLQAIADGVRDGDIPAEHRAFFEPVRLDRASVAKRKALEARVSAWRRVEAAQRKVDEQAVLPGHCAQDVVSVLAGLEPDQVGPSASPELRAALARIPGLGARRADRYADVFSALAAQVAEAGPLSASSSGSSPVSSPVSSPLSSPVSSPVSSPMSSDAPASFSAGSVSAVSIEAGAERAATAGVNAGDPTSGQGSPLA